MRYQSILIIGGTGFIGSRLVALLADSGRRIVVPTRRYANGRHLATLPSVDVVEANVHDDSTLRNLIRDADAVINLAGILHDRRAASGKRYGTQFARTHVDLPRRIVTACASCNVQRHLHMSALGAAANGPSMYLRSKADGEAAARSEPMVAATIFRPSVVFGEGDHFLNLFARLQRFVPLMLLACADAKFQPIYVRDVAQAFVNALDEERSAGKIYELAGPQVYTLRQLVRLAGLYAGHPRPIIGLPAVLGRLQAMVLEFLPGGPLMSRDNLDSMKVDNVAAGPIAPELRVTPTALEAVAPRYLGGMKVRHGIARG